MSSRLRLRSRGASRSFDRERLVPSGAGVLAGGRGRGGGTGEGLVGRRQLSDLQGCVCGLNKPGAGAARVPPPWLPPRSEIDSVKPKFVLNCAGVTGRPNVDWCEDHKAETIRVNVIGTMSLIDLCETRGIHVTNFATGCIYKYDDEHTIGGKGFTEEDKPNFTGSFYSLTKGMVETMCRAYKHVLTLRFRMPISDDLNHRNFVTKITKYARVVDIPNSMTTLFDMLPVAALMIHKGLTGVFNFTNPGAVSHNEILTHYRTHVDPTFWWANFTEEQCNAILKAERSNNTLDTTKLETALADVRIPPIKEAVEGVFIRMAENLKAEGAFPPVNFKDSEGIPKPADAK